MLQSLKVCHALGKTCDKKTGLPFSQALGNRKNPKGPSSIILSYQMMPMEDRDHHHGNTGILHVKVYFSFKYYIHTLKFISSN